MKNYNDRSRGGSKGSVAVLVFSFVAVVAVMGVYTFTRFQDNMEQKMAEEELKFKTNTLEEFRSEIANTNDIINELPDTLVKEEELGEKEASASDVVVPKLTFTEDSTMMWPVDGGVIMTYSMDQSVYFATLDQYKRNNAMIIEGEVGSEVLASEYGVVQSIDDCVETGRTITVDMGGGYEAIYGQLTDVKVSVGAIVEKGQILGKVAEPSRYYSVEGPNLYFQLTKDGTAIDPLEFLE